VYPEWQRRQQETERQKIERNFAKLRREQSGRGSLLNLVRHFWHTLEPPTRDLIEGGPSKIGPRVVSRAVRKYGSRPAGVD
jgi:hypothetical protein